MNSLLEICLKAVIGGLFVVCFALVAEAVQPKRLAGVFAAAPSVALGSLIVTVAFKGHHDAALAARAMGIGAVAFTVYCLVSVPALGRLGALRGSATAIVVWIVLAGAVVFLVMP
ncbi:DUF3147 family protein [Streptantibioticus rubrisoli]|uniref:DUF3147 family protein n=1 Tax=Streptantibioticus rubrisoli TaxID=1387313 RepID=A0ABT1PEF9_9ACTN|nr:DUF3147 family protein [Streptantibioticus rubrisoli]MCQ4043766.1 DUF3147 family protein [Streptantibioticus rubrisoli]